MLHPRSNEDVLVDSKRGTKIYVRTTYPDSGGPYPVIVFSHGAGGSRHGYAYLADYWAAHGFVCIQPSHADSITLNREMGNRFSFVKLMRSLPSDRQSWLDRAHDVSFVIDSLPQLSQSGPLEGKLSAGTVCVAGHSLGAFTCQLIGGASVPPVQGDSTVADVTDRRVACIIAISPQGVRADLNSLGFETKASYAGLTLPALFLTGDRDESIWNGSAQRSEAFENSSAGDKYLVSINGANHMTFVGMEKNDTQTYGQLLWEKAAESKMQTAYGDELAHLKLTQEITTLFIDAYLKRDTKSREMLQSNGLQALVGPNGVARNR